MIKLLSLILIPIILISKELVIDSVNKDVAIVNEILPLNHGGIVKHNFDDNHSIILSYGYVDSVDDNKNISYIKMKKFDSLFQDALPTITLTPAKSDIFNISYFHNMAIIISPNGESYKKVVNSYGNLNFMHIDQLATYLAKQKSPYPTKREIFEFCKSNFIGLLLVVIDNRVYTFDTISQKIILKESIEYSSKNRDMPFYSRVDDISSSIFEFDISRGNESYNSYYLNLFGVKNDR